MRFGAVVFDFDGVVADSELVANTNLAATLTACGMPTTLDDSLDHYMGHHWDDCLARITERWGRPPPEDLRERRRTAWEASQIDAIGPIPGVAAFLKLIGDTPRAIASSSSPEWIEAALNRFGLMRNFEGRVFSAAVHVSRGKPHPDIYEHAMRALGVAPADTLVIEDTPVGVRAGVASGAFTVGLLAGAHVRPGHGERLRAAGAHALCAGYDKVWALCAA